MRIDGFQAAAIGLIIASLLMAFIGLGSKTFWASHAESRRAEIARNMIDSSDYLVPQVNGQPILTKPPLYYWTVALAFKGAGRFTEGIARIPSAVFGLMTLALVFMLGAMLYDQAAGLYASAVLATSYLFSFFMRFAELDMTFTFFITLSFYFLARLNGEPTTIWGVLFWVGAGLAFMVKGPFALLYPLGGYFALLVLERDGALSKLKAVFQPRGLLLFLAIVAPWFLYVLFYTEAGAVFMEEAARRVIDRRGQDRGYFYYFESLGNFAPWVLLLPFAIYWAIRRDFRQSGFALAWLVVGFAVASLISAKNAHYILPLYPAMALLVGRYISAQTGRNKALPWVALFFCILCAILLIALPFAPLVSNEAPDVSIPLTFCLAAAAVALTWYAYQYANAGAFHQMWAAVFAALFILITFAHAHVVPRLNNSNSHKPFLLEAKRIVKPEDKLWMYRIENFQVSFYMERVAPVLWTKDDLKQISKEPNNGKRYIITEARFRDELAGVEVLEDNDYNATSQSKRDEKFVMIAID